MLYGAALVSTPSMAKKQPPPPPMPVGYDNPGPQPKNPLPGIIAKLRQGLNDPSSIRDVTMCSARAVPAFNVGSTWVPAGWIIQLTLNAKNRFGGYVGAVDYTADFKDGAVSEVAKTPPIEMLLPAVKPSYVSTALDCPRIPNTEIQKLLAD